MIIYIMVNFLNLLLWVGDGVRLFCFFGRAETNFVRVRMICGVRFVAAHRS